MERLHLPEPEAALLVHRHAAAWPQCARPRERPPCDSRTPLPEELAAWVQASVVAWLPPVLRIGAASCESEDSKHDEDLHAGYSFNLLRSDLFLCYVKVLLVDGARGAYERIIYNGDGTQNAI
jgi:hypothetical protein